MYDLIRLLRKAMKQNQRKKKDELNEWQDQNEMSSTCDL